MIEIRSYRRVFDLERRIYRVDRLRLNPGGVPVRGVVYFVAILAFVTLVAELPLLGAGERLLPWYLRELALPAALATVLAVVRVEGRPFHLAAQALARYWAGPRRLVGLRRNGISAGRWDPPGIVLLPDGSDSRMRRLRYTGPGAVLISVEHERGGPVIERGDVGIARRGGRRSVMIREPAGARAGCPGRVLTLAQGAQHARAGEKRPAAMSAPIAFVYGNCVFAEALDDAWAAFAVGVSSYAWLGDDSKRAPFLALVGALESIEADVQILRVATPVAGWALHTRAGWRRPGIGFLGTACTCSPELRGGAGSAPRSDRP